MDGEVMEDLGNINITIRDGAGGGASGGNGSGQPGMGPLVPSRWRQLIGLGTRLPTSTGAGATEAAATTKMASLFDKLQQGLNVTGELGSAIRSPSVSGLLSLGQTSSATGSAIAGLGSAAAVAGPILIAVVGAVMLAKVAIEKLAQASEYVFSRIREVTRFSGQLQYATATERLAEFQRQLQDASINGAAYARVQQLQTVANDAQQKVMIRLNSIFASMAELFQRLRIAAYGLLDVVLSLLAKIPWRAIITAMQAALQAFVRFQQAILSAFQSIITTIQSIPLIGNLPSLTFAQGYLNFFQQVLALLQGILGNTTPQPQAKTGNLNAWFMGDVRAITGRAY
jgi:hypothetical protein